MTQTKRQVRAMTKRRRHIKWKKLEEAVQDTVNALIEYGLPRNQGAAAASTIYAVLQWYENKNSRWWL